MALIRPETAKVRREIPHEPGEWMDIRPLTGVELDAARQVTSDRAMATLRSLPPEIVKAQQAAAAEARAKAAFDGKAAAVEPTEPDAATLIKHGLVGWSYTDPLTPENVALLDAATRDWLAGAIKALCVVRDAASVKESATA
jgi:hypothetical protein